ncbi:MAG: hypothetical protein KGZ62_01205 [Sulfurimonas sp.]|nr:hypothetical protein [Sulfurimonas sp.]
MGLGSRIGGGGELFLQVVGPEVIAVVSVPSPARLLVPLSFACRIATSHLTLFEFWAGCKPLPANPAWPLVALCGHRFLSFEPWGMTPG